MASRFTAACCLLTCLAVATLASAAPMTTRPQPRTRASSALRLFVPRNPSGIGTQFTRTSLVGLLASGDVRMTFTELQDNLVKNGRKRFEASTRLPGVQRMVWQLAMAPYPDQSGADWQSPMGLVDMGEVSGPFGPGRASIFEVDLGSYLRSLRLNRMPRPVAMEKLDPKLLNHAPETPERSRSRAVLPRRNPLAHNRFGGSSASKGKKTEKVITYYVRVVPLDAEGQRLGTPSSAVVIRHLAKVEDFKFDRSTYTLHPTVTPLAWEPSHAARPNYQYWVLVTRRPFGFGVVPGVSQSALSNVAPGGRLVPPVEAYWPPQDKSWLDKIGDAVSSFVDWVAGAVNWISEAYNSLKGLVIDGLSQLAPDLREVFSVALDMGLIAIGVPPSLPDFDDLTNLGVDYMCEYVEEETGVPADVTKAALSELSAKTKEMRETGGNATTWFVPDPYAQYRPARLDFEVRNNLADRTDPVTVFVDVIAPVPAGELCVAAANPVPVPSLAPGEALTIPVFVRGAPGYAETAKLKLTTYVRLELDDSGNPTGGKMNPLGGASPRLFHPKQAYDAAQWQAAAVAQ